MKISCILSSYNRPKMVRQALQSVLQQTYQNFELLIFDHSTIFNIHETVKSFPFQRVQVFHRDVPFKQRTLKSWLGVSCNEGLRKASGDVLCYLCDDDYYYPDWFASAAAFFGRLENADKKACFGRLIYSSGVDFVFPKNGESIMHAHPIGNPACRLDHNQVMHRRFTPPYLWPEEWAHVGAPDAVYFDCLAKNGVVFYPVQGAYAVVKRRHSMNLQWTVSDLGTPRGEGARE